MHTATRRVGSSEGERLDRTQEAAGSSPARSTRTPHAQLIQLRQYRRLQAAAVNVCSNGMARRVRSYMQEFLAQHGWTLAELALANEQAGTTAIPHAPPVLVPYSH